MMDEDGLVNAALNNYTDYWESKPSFSKYETRWEALTAAYDDKDFTSMCALIREAHVAAFLAGVTLRLTGE